VIHGAFLRRSEAQQWQRGRLYLEAFCWRLTLGIFRGVLAGFSGGGSLQVANIEAKRLQDGAMLYSQALHRGHAGAA